MEFDNTGIDANAAAPSSDADSMLSSPDFQGTNPGADGADVGDGDGKATTDTDKTADQNATSDKKAGSGAEDGKGKEGGEEDRYDKLPRFQELNATIKAEREARTKAEAELSLLKRSPLNPEFLPPAGDKPGFKDINTMTAEEVREWQEDDPLGFAQNLKQQAAWEAKQSLKGDSLRDETVSRIEQTFNQYAKENPTFNAMWESGEIEKFMNEHPGHNAISAHMAMSASTQQDSIKKMVDDAVAKAVKETEERVTKNFQAKRNATVIAPGGAQRAPAGEIDPALADTSKFGGNKTVLAARLAAMRAGQAGG